MIVRKTTPVRIVEHIEDCLDFWCGALGYHKAFDVPHEGAIGFASLSHPAGDLMFQTRASLAADLPEVAALSPEIVLFVEVDSVREARAAAAGARVLVDERTTFYGTRETVLVSPGGSIVIFAEPLATDGPSPGS